MLQLRREQKPIPVHRCSTAALVLSLRVLVRRGSHLRSLQILFARSSLNVSMMHTLTLWMYILNGTCTVSQSVNNTRHFDFWISTVPVPFFNQRNKCKPRILKFRPCRIWTSLLIVFISNYGTGGLRLPLLEARGTVQLLRFRNGFWCRFCF
jgi:hypothetical protein